MFGCRHLRRLGVQVVHSVACNNGVFLRYHVAIIRVFDDVIGILHAVGIFLHEVNSVQTVLTVVEIAAVTDDSIVVRLDYFRRQITFLIVFVVIIAT